MNTSLADASLADASLADASLADASLADAEGIPIQYFVWQRLSPMVALSTLEMLRPLNLSYCTA